jgi:hypothetical protein
MSGTNAALVAHALVRAVETLVFWMRPGTPIAMKTIAQPHASAWGYFYPRNTPTLTHGANCGHSFSRVSTPRAFSKSTKGILPKC